MPQKHEMDVKLTKKMKLFNYNHMTNFNFTLYLEIAINKQFHFHCST